MHRVLTEKDIVLRTAAHRSSRLPANPDLFKPNPARPQSRASSGRRVSFQDGPPEEIKVQYPKSPSPGAGFSAVRKNSKWQPLATVEPSPVTDHDPFSLGDSEDDDRKAAVSEKDKENAKVLDSSKAAPSNLPTDTQSAGAPDSDTVAETGS